MKSFVEVQFPVAQLSIESYIERDAKAAKPLSSLAKWWGAKPIVLSRALLIGTVMPAHEDQNRWPKDLEIFLRIMTLDPDGMWHRKNKPIPAKICWPKANEKEREQLLHSQDRWKVRSNDSARIELEKRVFYQWSFSEQREYCCRVDQVEGLPSISWKRINEYFGFNDPISSLEELIPCLSEQRFGRVISVGDAFAGSGIIPLASAQIGLPSYAADLNPAASLLAWNAVNLIGGTKEFRQQVEKLQNELYEKVQEWLAEHDYEKSEEGWNAHSYLYCEEIKVPEWDNWAIPVVPSWVVAPKTETWVELIPNIDEKRFNFTVRYGGDGWNYAYKGTKDEDTIICPEPLWIIFQEEGTHRNRPKNVSKKELIERAGGLRKWEKKDVIPRENDILQEKLFCIRWNRPKPHGKGVEAYYRETTVFDVENERKMTELLVSVKNEWMKEGWLPAWSIEEGYKTTEPIRTKGWTHWHHLFTPHQLLVLGKYSQLISEQEKQYQPALLMALAKILDMNNRLCHWLASQGGGIGGSKRLFYNQAFNTFPNYAGRGWMALSDQAHPKHISITTPAPVAIDARDARKTEHMADLWLTDPPYADAVHYEELTEFFLAWYSPHLQRCFPDWPKDSRRMQTIKGDDEGFVSGMTQGYSRLAEKMADDGYQLIMFTHKSSDIWSDLTMIVWEAGLEILAVWNVATETSGLGVRSGDHVQTTYNLVLKKRNEEKIGFLDQIKRQVKKSAAAVIKRMEEERSQMGPYTCGYGETDVLLAAQAAAAQVITSYKTIADFSGRNKDDQRVGIRSVLETARLAAADQLLPKKLKYICSQEGINAENWWKDLCPEERMYLKALEVSTSGEARLSAYQDLARIYGVSDYSELMASVKPNEARPSSPIDISPGRTARFEETSADERETWKYSVTRNVLIALKYTTDSQDAETGVSHLKLTTAFWNKRSDRIIPTIRYFETIAEELSPWEEVKMFISALDTAVRNARA